MTNQLVEAFKNAIVLEQESDILLTNSYLSLYSPKKLAGLGLAIINLIVDNVRTGFGGKTLIELVLDPAVKNELGIQLGSLRVGDIVKLDKMSNSSEEGIQARKAVNNLSKKISDNSTKTHKSESAISSPDSFDAVVIKVNSHCITVSIEEDSDEILHLYNNTNETSKMWIVKVSNSVTYKRMISTMNKLGEFGDTHGSEIIELLLGQRKYSQHSGSTKLKEKDFFNTELNESQKQAIDFAINQSPITIIHGPPGTGKTYTLIELIKQLTFNKGERVLVCGPSNISVDTILERLSPMFAGDDKKKRGGKKPKGNPEKLIRIGHPARLLANNLQHSLDILSKTSAGGDNDNKAILRDIEKDISETLAKAKKCKRYSERRVYWGELKELKKELRIREKKIVQDLLVNSQVVLCTLHGAGSYDLTSLYKEPSLSFGPEQPLFDTIIIDEVSQSLEPQCWIPLVNHLGFKRLVIAGDNMQLPPTVKSQDEVERMMATMKIGEQGKLAKLEETLFDRLMRDHEGEKFKRLLNIQYRMNETIMRFPSQVLYGGELKAHSSVENIQLDIETEGGPCIWYDTQGGDYIEQESEAGQLGDTTGSKFNEMEAMVVIKHLKLLMSQGVDAESIGLISPYNAQVSLLKKLIHPEDKMLPVEISTVDGFQSREKEVIIISLVRSNDHREVGFLRDKRRLNVAMTRPKRQLCIVGDLELMGTSGVEFLKQWSEYVENPDSGFEVIYPELGDY